MPFGVSRYDLSAACLARKSESSIAKAVKATFGRNATSGLHSWNSTVCASIAVICLNSPVYAACAASGAAASPQGAAPDSG